MSNLKHLLIILNAALHQDGIVFRHRNDTIAYYCRDSGKTNSTMFYGENTAIPAAIGLARGLLYHDNNDAFDARVKPLLDTLATLFIGK